MRTPIGTAGHALAHLDAATLAVDLLRAAGSDRQISDVLLGNCFGPGGNPARVAAIAAIGPGTPGATIDRQCASGLAAVALAAAAVRPGQVLLAGGTESASTAPTRIDHHTGQPYAQAPMAPPGHPDPHLGAAADALAESLGISRQRQDEYAARSHHLAATACADGTFDTEILPLEQLSRDERPRPGLTCDRLARLRPAFGGTATPGNACGISDGAAILRVEFGTQPGLVIRDTVTVGCDPALPGLGAGLAINALLERNTLRSSDIDAVEITEAFASVALAAIEIADLRLETVCAQGGAIGYGHPWGASGAILLVRLFSRLVRADTGRLGIAACAVGGGQGMAMLMERRG